MIFFKVDNFLFSKKEFYDIIDARRKDIKAKIISNKDDVYFDGMSAGVELVIDIIRVLEHFSKITGDK